MPMRLYHKILLIMRLTTVFLIASLVQVSAAGFAQKISLSRSNASLKSVIGELRKQSGYDFVYNDKVLGAARPISIQIKQMEFEQALEQIFKDQKLTYTIDSKTVIIKEKEESFIDRMIARFQEIDVRGRVVDEKGQGIPGATIKVKDKARTTITDGSGYFLLKNVDDGAVLVISYIGYEGKEVTAAEEVTVQLKLSESKLDEVQVIAYGKTTRRFDLGNTASVKAADIEFSPVTNLLLAIQGRVPGISISQYNGYAGGAVKTMIQGQNSIGNGNNPFIVVDGIPYPDQMIQNNASVLDGPPPGGKGNTLSYLNPADIESISILKDADATAIYGSRAANGAILITTKKGVKGAMKTDLRFDQGWQTPSRYVKMLNTQQYLEMRKEAFKNTGSTVGDYDYDLNGAWDTTRYTDWQKKLIGTAKYTDVKATTSGGSENVNYLAGATYHRETGTFPISTPNQIFAFHSSLLASSANKKFRATLTSNFQVNDTRLPGDEMSRAYTLAPDAPQLFNPDGSLNWQPTKDRLSTFLNPLAPILKFEKLKVSNLIMASDLTYEILPGLQAKLAGGYTQMNSNDVNGEPLSSFSPAGRPDYSNSASFNTGRQTTWSLEPQINFQKNWGSNHLDVLLGGTLQKQELRSSGFKGDNYSSELLLENPAAAGNYYGFSSDAFEYRYNAVFGRVNYRYKDRYLLSGSVRRDGSSRFGPANRFANFYSVGGGWIFTEESFGDFLKPVLSFGKLRLNYGTTGNDQIGNYSYINNYNTYTVGTAYNNIQGLLPGQIFNPYLQWEQTRKLSAGVNFGFLKDRILVDVSWYRNRSSNQLLDLSLPTTTGFNSIKTNLPALVQNTGLEISLTTVNFKDKELEWTSSFNITRNRNKLLRFDAIDKGYADRFFIGYPLGTQKVFKYAGVNPSTGNYQFVKADGTISENPNYNQDRFLFLDLQPAFYGGFNNTIRWKSFALDFLLQFAKNKSVNYSYGIQSPPGSYNNNQPISVLDRWQKPGDHSDVQRFTNDYSNGGQIGARGASDGGYIDVRYMRLKNISLTWQLPQNWLKGVRSAQIYMQGQNVLTVTNSSFDPESGMFFPVLRTITAGFKLGL